MLAADCAPVTALAVGLETNVGREKASVAPSAPRLKLSLDSEAVKSACQEDIAARHLLLDKRFHEW